MEKPSLSATQKWMQQVLVSPLSFETDPNQFLPEAFQNDVEKLIKPNSRLSGKERLQIYQTGYLARLRDCMEKQFVQLKYALGDELFQAFSDDYLQRYPSESYTLSNLGDRFAEFLEETRPDRDYPPQERELWPDFMIELVQFEYKINLIFDAEFSSNFSYANNETEDTKLKLVEAIELLPFKFPISQYYQRAVRELNPQMPEPFQTYTAITRTKDFRIGLLQLNQGQYLFLSLLREHNQFDNTLEEFLKRTKSKKEDFLKVWPQWKAYFIESLLLIET